MDWTAFAASLDGVPTELDPVLVKQRSRDFYWYSPVLKPLLRGCTADMLAMPRDEDEVLRVVRSCVAARVPVTARGAGTGNYGQAVPLHGGVVLDLTGLDAVHPVRDGVLTAGAGARLIDIETATRPQGWELRMFPSTRRTATIGGFVAGGSGGVGSINYGMLRDRGNLLAARVVTLEAEPRVLALRGDDMLRVHHAYGTNGIITELEIAMAPAQSWCDVVVAFDDFMALARFCHAVASADGIAKRLLTAIAAPVPAMFKPLAAVLPAGEHAGFCIIAASGLDAFSVLLAEHGGTLCSHKSEAAVAADGDVPVYEYTWNHTTLQALKVDRTITYLQSRFAGDDYLGLVGEMIARFGDEVPMHLEFVRVGGRVEAAALQLVRFTTPARLDEIIAIHEASGVPVFNPHTYVLEDGGMKTTDPAQLAFKRLADPFNLANPGKMRGWTDEAAAV